ncbi:MAG: hypothetical protein ACYDEQ_10085 [Desulfocucumaceae bacterium]
MFRLKFSTHTIVIILVIAITFSLFSFFLHNTRAISETRLVLEIKSNKADTDGYYISNITALDSVVTKLNSRFEDKNLLSIYEREREHYILLLTVLGLLLTISIAYTIINRIVEKDEVLAHEKRIKILEDSLTTELKHLKVVNVVNEFVELGKSLRSGKTTLLNDGIVVKTEDDLIKYLKPATKKMYSMIKKEDPEKQLQTRAIDIFNFINSVLIYADLKGISKNQQWSETKNKLFKALITWMEDVMGTENYKVFKEHICNLPGVNWGD